MPGMPGQQLLYPTLIAPLPLPLIFAVGTGSAHGSLALPLPTLSPSCVPRYSLSSSLSWTTAMPMQHQHCHRHRLRGGEADDAYCSCVGVWKNGRVEIIANDQGNRITPSYVAWTDDDQRLIGDAAKNQASANPENTVFDAKRLIGRKFSDESVQADLQHWPFEVADAGGKPKVVVTGGRAQGVLAGGDLGDGADEDARRRGGVPRQGRQVRRRHGAGLLQRRAAAGDQGRGHDRGPQGAARDQRADGGGDRVRPRQA